ncbi:hypothetical protein LPJ61_002674 [Coemansia biformis]|uniref:Uncharacterized protein n=1 Tax=Coemansia biformis TaxID=1286918 RepID=A0A9W7YCV6_9FUNG|nr:hypothetical protein LPJ61_002674 [Coemansia biformis]
MAEKVQGGGSQCLLQDVLENGHVALGDCENAKSLPFALIEVHLGADQDQMPDWIAHLFFESALVHPVLDFDLYLHAIATLCPLRAASLPYWLVDCSRGPFSAPPGTPTAAAVASPDACSSPDPHAPALRSSTPSYSLVDIPQRAAAAATAPASPPLSETTQLLPGSAALLSPRHPAPLHPTLRELRRTLAAALATAVVVSVVLTVWPCHQQVARIVVELADLLAQWVDRLLRRAV